MSMPISFVRTLTRGLEWLARIELVAVALMLVAALFISAYAIVARNLGYSTGDWALSLPEVLLVWITFLGAGSLVTRNEHVTADFLLALLPASLRRGTLAVLLCLAAGALVPVCWGSGQIVIQMWSIGMRNSELLNAPQALVQAAIPLGIGLCVLHLLGKCLEICVLPSEHEA